MSSKSDAPSKGIEGRFRDLSADVREERLVRYILHQVENGRRAKEIINDPYVVQHFDEVARSRILEHPQVIKGIEMHMRRQFAGYGDSVGGAKAAPEGPDSAGRSDNGIVPDL